MVGDHRAAHGRQPTGGGDDLPVGKARKEVGEAGRGGGGQSAVLQRTRRRVQQGALLLRRNLLELGHGRRGQPTPRAKERGGGGVVGRRAYEP